MTWVDVLMSLSPADLSLLLACVNLLILLLNAASGWREVDLSPHECWRFWRGTARRVIGKLWSLTRADFAELTGVFKTAHKKP